MKLEVLIGGVVVFMVVAFWFIGSQRLEQNALCKEAGGVLISSGRSGTACIAAEAVIWK